MVPDQAEWSRRLTASAARIAHLGRRYLEDRSQSLDWLSRRLTQSSPAATVGRQRDWLINLRLVMVGVVRHDLNNRGRKLDAIRARLMQRSPSVDVQQSINRLAALRQRLHVAANNAVNKPLQRLRLATRGLDSVSPLATLERGYAIITDASSGKIVTRATSIKSGTSITARLAEGSLEATVTTTKDGAANGG